MLDLTTTGVIGSIVAVISGTSLLILARRYPNAETLRWFAAGAFFVALGLSSDATGLFASSEIAQSFLMLCMLQAHLLFLIGARTVNAHPVRPWRMHLLLHVPAISGFVLFVSSHAAWLLWLWFYTAMLVLLVLLAARELLEYDNTETKGNEDDSNPRSVRYFIGLPLLGHALFHIWGAAMETASVLGIEHAAVRPEMLHGFIMLASMILAIMVSMGISNLHYERFVGRLRRAARTDELTGLPNRTLFEEFFHRVARRSDDSNSAFALLVIDLDEFKAVNDRHGHQHGDHVLTETARILQETVRPTDMVARIGGDEFAAVLPDTAASRAGVVATRIRRTFATDNDENGEWPGISVGVAIYPDDGEDYMALFRTADNDLYHNKRNQIAP